MYSIVGYNCLFATLLAFIQNLLQNTIFQDLALSVMGILNDATGTLLSCAHKNPNCRIGIIIGESRTITALTSE